MQSLYPLSQQLEANANLAPPTESPTQTFAQPQHEYRSQSTGNGGLLNSSPTSLNIVTAAAAGTSHNVPFVPSYTDPSLDPNGRFSDLGHSFPGSIAMNEHHAHVGSHYPYTYMVRSYRRGLSPRG